MEQEKQEQSEFASKDVTFDSNSGYVFYKRDCNSGTINMYLGSRRKCEVVDIESYERYGLNKAAGTYNTYVLNSIETGEYLCFISSGLPKLDQEIYKSSPLISRWKCNFYDRKYHKDGLSIEELKKFTEAYRDCLTVYCNRVEAERRALAERNKKLAEARNAQRNLRDTAVEQLLEMAKK